MDYRGVISTDFSGYGDKGKIDSLTQGKQQQKNSTTTGKQTDLPSILSKEVFQLQPFL